MLKALYKAIETDLRILSFSLQQRAKYQAVILNLANDEVYQLSRPIRDLNPVRKKLEQRNLVAVPTSPAYVLS